MGVDLLAFALLMATLRDWFVICQSRVPTVFGPLVSRSARGGLVSFLTPRPGVSIPAVTTRLDMTKQDIRNGRKTGSPVSTGGQEMD